MNAYFRTHAHECGMKGWTHQFLSGLRNIPLNSPRRVESGSVTRTHECKSEMTHSWSYHMTASPRSKSCDFLQYSTIPHMILQYHVKSLGFCLAQIIGRGFYLIIWSLSRVKTPNFQVIRQLNRGPCKSLALAIP